MESITIDRFCIASGMDGRSASKSNVYHQLYLGGKQCVRKAVSVEPVYHKMPRLNITRLAKHLLSCWMRAIFERNSSLLQDFSGVLSRETPIFSSMQDLVLSKTIALTLGCQTWDLNV